MSNSYRAFNNVQYVNNEFLSFSSYKIVKNFMTANFEDKNI